MRIIFEGHLPARQEAEIKSKKESSELWVVKTFYEGLRYYVVDDPKSVEGKVLDHYKNGVIQK
jgi:hypothetical protein